MSRVLQNLRKKRGFPTVIDGDTYHVRPMEFGELFRVDSLFPITAATDSDTPEQQAERMRQSQRKTAFNVGCVLCASENGEPEFPRRDNETAGEFADRLCIELADVGWDKLRAINDAAASAGGSKATVETLAKN